MEIGISADVVGIVPVVEAVRTHCRRRVIGTTKPSTGVWGNALVVEQLYKSLHPLGCEYGRRGGWRTTPFAQQFAWLDGSSRVVDLENAHAMFKLRKASWVGTLIAP